MGLQVVDRWTTRAGKWEANGEPYSITQEQIDTYGTWNIPGKGGDTHIFVIAQPGDIITFFTTDGNPKNVKDVPADKYGVANFGMWLSSHYWPPALGPWGVKVNGVEVVRGLGLPEGYHVSTFLVVRERDSITIPLPSLPFPSGDTIQVVIRTMRDGIQTGEQVVWPKS